MTPEVIVGTPGQVQSDSHTPPLAIYVIVRLGMREAGVVCVSRFGLTRCQQPEKVNSFSEIA